MTYETISAMSLKDIKLFLAQEIFDDGCVCAQDIKDLADKFPSLAEKIQGCNFSKKETWVKIACWWNTHDCEEPLIDEGIIFSPCVQELISCEGHISDEQIDIARQKFVEFYPDSTAIVLAPKKEIAHPPQQKNEHTWVYFALVCFISVLLIAGELTANFLTWLTTWAIPAFLQFSHQVFQSGKNVRSLYEQIRGVNYLFIV